MTKLTAPFPYFGGKGAVAHLVWDHLGDVDRYIEPFGGSAAVLLARPSDHRYIGRYREMVNDKAHFVSNFWRAVQAKPLAVAEQMDWPINETDLHSRQHWLVTEGKERLLRCEMDPAYYDTQAAAWWAWGASCWIGSNWATDGRHAKPNMTPRGINRLSLDEWSQDGFLPHNEAIRRYLVTLSTRLRQVRVLSGDWKRCVKSSEVTAGKNVGVFLDPPYASHMREKGLYYHDDSMTEEITKFCLEHGDTTRIVLAGLTDEYNLPWSVVAWKANRSFASSRTTANSSGRSREQLWISPKCLPRRRLIKRQRRRQIIIQRRL